MHFFSFLWIKFYDQSWRKKIDCALPCQLLFLMIVLQVHQNVEPQTERVDQCRRAVPEHCLPNVWDGFLLSRALSGGYRYLPGKTIVSADDWISDSHYHLLNIQYAGNIVNHRPDIYSLLISLQIRLWLITIGVSLVFGPMFAKAWRVYQIFQNAGVKRVVGIQWWDSISIHSNSWIIKS